MSSTRRAGAVRGRLGAGILGLAVAAACAPAVTRRQTAVMEKSGQVSVSAAQLRSRLNAAADRFADQYEETADRIRAQTKDRAVRRRALAFKVDAVPAVYAAAYRAEPLAATVDVWALAFQAVQYFDDGAGRDLFGDQQKLAREATRGLLAEVDEAIRRVATRPDVFDQARANVEGWARDHPIRHTFSSRPSAAGIAAAFRADGRNAFVAVGEATETLETVTERLNTYAAQLPKLARWQAELLVSDEAGGHDVQTALADVAALGAAARRANALLDDVPALVSAGGAPVRDLVAEERRSVLDAVNRQRLQTLDYVTAERVALVGVLREERLATPAALRQERIETLKEVDAIKTRAVESAIVGLRDLFEYALWRVGVLLLAGLIAATVLGVVGYRLAVGRSPHPA